MLIEQDQPVVEVYSHQPDGSWKMVTYIGLEEKVILHSVDCKIDMKDIFYATLDLQQPNFRLFKEE